MSQEARRSGQLWAGVVLIALGVLFLLDRMDVLAFRWVFRDWWPSVLILIGVMQMVTGRHRSRGWAGPLVVITVGVIFQVQRLHVFYWWDMRTMWPAILIAVGLGMLIGRLRQHNRLDGPGTMEAKS